MEPFIGQIALFGFNFAPRGWALCNGQLLPISQNQALFALLGTIYGGDGRTTFALPDLRGRVPIHFGQGPGLSNYRQGQRGGVENVTLNVNQLPPHAHPGSIGNNASTEDGTTTNAAGNVPANAAANIYTAAPDASLGGGALNIGNTGGGQSHTNVQPYLAVNYCIALIGTFPSRS